MAGTERRALGANRHRRDEASTPSRTGRCVDSATVADHRHPRRSRPARARRSRRRIRRRPQRARTLARDGASTRRPSSTTTASGSRIVTRDTASKPSPRRPAPAHGARTDTRDGASAQSHTGRRADPMVVVDRRRVGHAPRRGTPPGRLPCRSGAGREPPGGAMRRGVRSTRSAHGPARDPGPVPFPARIGPRPRRLVRPPRRSEAPPTRPCGTPGSPRPPQRREATAAR